MIASTMKFHCASEGLSKKEDLMMDLKPLLVNALLYSFAVEDFTVNIDNQREYHSALEANLLYSPNVHPLPHNTAF